jgi:MFS transporter, FHS family, glucose/mannose:H+ symporter
MTRKGVIMYNKKLVFIAACFGMLIFGIVMAVLGAVLPSLIVKFDIDKIDAGSLFLLLSFGMLIGSMMFGPVVDRYGYKGLLIICTALVMLGFQGIAYAPSMFLLRFSLLFIGLGGGAINGGTNALVSDISEENRGAGLAFLGAFFGVGAFGVPLLLGSFLGRFSYEMLIAGVGTMIILPWLLFVFLRFPKPKHEQGFPIAEGLGLTKQTTLLLLGLILFIQSGMEMTVGGWSATFLNEELEVDPQRAVLFLSLFWFSMVFARLLLGNVLRFISTEVVLRASLSIAFIGSLVLIFSGAPGIAVIGLILVGFGFAAVFPVIFAYVGDLYSKLSGTAFSVVLVMALTGGMLYPYGTGILANSYGLKVALLPVPCSIICSGIVFWIVLRRVSNSKRSLETTGV